MLSPTFQIVEIAKQNLWWTKYGSHILQVAMWNWMKRYSLRSSQLEHYSFNIPQFGWGSQALKSTVK